MRMERSEGDLLEAAGRGERQAIEEILARHEAQIYRFGLRMCGDEESARDVLQETMLAAFRNLPGFRGEATLSTWLYQIAPSFCIKHRRGERPFEPLPRELEEPAGGPDTRAHAREIGAALAAGIRALPLDYREALVL